MIVDDMIDTGGTIDSLSRRLVDAGARNVYVWASHGLFSGEAVQVIEASPIKRVIVTNTLPPPEKPSSKIEQVSIAQMLAHVILAEHFRSVNAVDEVFEYEE